MPARLARYAHRIGDESVRKQRLNHELLRRMSEWIEVQRANFRVHDIHAARAARTQWVLCHGEPTGDAQGGKRRIATHVIRMRDSALGAPASACDETLSRTRRRVPRA